MDIKNKISIISFNIDSLYHGTVASILSLEGGIAVRNGCFCAQPYIQKLLNISIDEMEKYKQDESLLRPGTVRISFGLYNDYQEVNVLIELLNQIAYNRKKYNLKYKTLLST